MSSLLRGEADEAPFLVVSLDEPGQAQHTTEPGGFGPDD
jgi:hypothetical protein